MIRKILIGLLFVLVVIQFIRPAKNQGNDQSKHINTLYAMPDDVKQILAVACDDCHSNNTRYPWYNNIQPVAWWLADHVKEGKGHLNFSELAGRRTALQYHKMEEVVEMVDEGEMPLKSYTLTHGDARLSTDQRKKIIDWAQSVMDAMKMKFPADSLVMPERPASPPPGN